MRRHFSNFKRGLSLVLSLVLCLSLVTPVAHAEDEHDHGDDYGISTLAATDDKTTCTHPDWTHYGRSYLGWGYDVCDSCGAWRWTFALVIGTFRFSWDLSGSTPGTGEKPEEPDTSCKHPNAYRVNEQTATCKTPGYTGDTYCPDCKLTIEVGQSTDLAPNNHEGDTEVRGTVTATCKTAGYTGDTYCLGCGNKIADGTNTGLDAGHHEGGTEVRDAVEATCTTKGYTGDTYCRGCNTQIATGTETAVDSDAHKAVQFEGKDATCTEAGYEAGTKCEYCGVTLSGGWEIPANGHTWGEWKTTLEPTCTTPGSKTHECSVCHKLESAEIAANDHAYVHHDEVMSTCTKPGNMEYYSCENCSELFDRNKIHADNVVRGILNHDFDNAPWSKNATQHWLECKRKCNETGYQVSIEDHKWSEWTIDIDAGKATRSCTVCGYNEEKTIPGFDPASPGKDWELISTQDPTCTDKGVKTYQWKENTAVTRRVEIPALGHLWEGVEPAWSTSAYEDDLTNVKADFHCQRAGCNHSIILEWRAAASSNEVTVTEEVTQAATCVAKGSKSYNASVYFDETQQTYTHTFEGFSTPIDPNNHSYADAWTSDDTHHWHVCEREESHTVSGKAEHTFGAWTITKAPTINEAGTATHECTVCGQEVEQVLPAIDPENPTGWTKDEAKSIEPTCNSTGSYEYSSEYGTVTVEIPLNPDAHNWGDTWVCGDGGNVHWHVCANGCGQRGEPTAHTMGEWEILNAPGTSFVAVGLAQRECKDGCGYHEDKTLPGLDPVNPDPSIWKKQSNSVEPTCEGEGTYYFKLIRDNEENDAPIVTVTMPATGHAYGDWTIVTDPTTEAEGSAQRVCANNSAHVETQPLAKLPANPNEIGEDSEWKLSAEKAPTCTEDGYYRYEHSVTKLTYDVVRPAAGHSYDSVVTAPTCTEGGYTTHTCSKCGDSYTDSATEATGHAYGDWTVTLAPTTEAAGTAVRTCSKCGYEETMTLPQLPTNPEEIAEPTDPEEGVWALSATVDPTCTAAGYYEYTHSLTSLTARVDRDALGHNYSTAWTTSADSHWHVCTRCGAVSGTAAHTWNGGTVTRYATYTSTGEMTYTCTVCSAARTETIPMLIYTPGPLPTDPTGPVGPTDPSAGEDNGNGDNGGEVDIGENETPLGDGEEIDIGENETPLASGLNLDRVAYLAGYEDGTVRPSNRITRAEVATVFYRLMSDLTREINWSVTNSFTDVEQDKWFNEAVSTAANAGILRGYGDSSFKPNNNITRAEFATIASRFLSVEVESAAVFTDVSGHWAEEAIGIVAGAGWIKGYEDGTFRPDETITRAEAAIIINRMLGRDITDRADDTRSWIDNPLTAWFYQDIQEATNGILLR